MTDLHRTDLLLDGLGARTPGTAPAGDELATALTSWVRGIDVGPQLTRVAGQRSARPGRRVRRVLGGGAVAVAVLTGSSVAAALTGTDIPALSDVGRVVVAWVPGGEDPVRRGGVDEVGARTEVRAPSAPPRTTTTVPLGEAGPAPAETSPALTRTQETVATPPARLAGALPDADATPGSGPTGPGRDGSAGAGTSVRAASGSSGPASPAAADPAVTRDRADRGPQPPPADPEPAQEVDGASAPAAAGPDAPTAVVATAAPVAGPTAVPVAGPTAVPERAAPRGGEQGPEVAPATRPGEQRQPAAAGADRAPAPPPLHEPPADGAPPVPAVVSQTPGAAGQDGATRPAADAAAEPATDLGVPDGAAEAEEETTAGTP